jgi:hypothetical protein
MQSPDKLANEMASDSSGCYIEESKYRSVYVATLCLRVLRTYLDGRGKYTSMTHAVIISGWLRDWPDLWESPRQDMALPKRLRIILAADEPLVSIIYSLIHTMV